MSRKRDYSIAVTAQMLLSALRLHVSTSTKVSDQLPVASGRLPYSVVLSNASPLANHAKSGHWPLTTDHRFPLP